MSKVKKGKVSPKKKKKKAVQPAAPPAPVTCEETACVAGAVAAACIAAACDTTNPLLRLYYEASSDYLTEINDTFSLPGVLRSLLLPTPYVALKSTSDTFLTIDSLLEPLLPHPPRYHCQIAGVADASTTPTHTPTPTPPTTPHTTTAPADAATDGDKASAVLPPEATPPMHAPFIQGKASLRAKALHQTRGGARLTASELGRMRFADVMFYLERGRPFVAGWCLAVLFKRGGIRSVVNTASINTLTQDHLGVTAVAAALCTMVRSIHPLLLLPCLAPETLSCQGWVYPRLLLADLRRTLWLFPGQQIRQVGPYILDSRFDGGNYSCAEWSSEEACLSVTALPDAGGNRMWFSFDIQRATAAAPDRVTIAVSDYAKNMALFVPKDGVTHRPVLARNHGAFRKVELPPTWRLVPGLSDRIQVAFPITFSGLSVAPAEGGGGGGGQQGGTLHHAASFSGRSALQSGAPALRGAAAAAASGGGGAGGGGGGGRTSHTLTRAHSAAQVKEQRDLASHLQSGLSPGEAAAAAPLETTLSVAFTYPFSYSRLMRYIASTLDATAAAAAGGGGGGVDTTTTTPADGTPPAPEGAPLPAAAAQHPAASGYSGSGASSAAKPQGGVRRGGGGGGGAAATRERPVAAAAAAAVPSPPPAHSPQHSQAVAAAGPVSPQAGGGGGVASPPPATLCLGRQSFRVETLCLSYDRLQVPVCTFSTPGDGAAARGAAEGTQLPPPASPSPPPPPPAAGDAACATAAPASPVSPAGGAPKCPALGESVNSASGRRDGCAAEGVPQQQFVGKPIVYITGRVHAGEVPASHMVHGFFTFLLAGGSKVERLLAMYDFRIVPMLNPDGVARGFSRCDARGVNLNRVYDDPDEELHSPIWSVCEDIQRLQGEGRRVYAFIDFHAHARKRGVFAYGNELVGPESDLQNLFVFLGGLRCPVFDYHCSNFTDVSFLRKNKDGSGRIAVKKRFGIPIVLTIEANYCTGDSISFASGKPVRTVATPFTPSVYQSVASGMLCAFLDLRRDGDPERDPLPGFSNTERIRRYLANCPVLGSKSKASSGKGAAGGGATVGALPISPPAAAASQGRQAVVAAVVGAAAVANGNGVDASPKPEDDVDQADEDSA